MIELCVDNPREVGRFVKGHHYSPSTEIRDGQRLSPRTEFARGQRPRNWSPVGTVRVRLETHTGLRRAWVKTAEPNIWKKRAVVVWETLHGPVPHGCVIHHKDRDSLNDDPVNLAALTLREHRAEHHEEILSARTGC